MTEFQRSLARVLVHEGGYVNHPADPGGATMKGVTQAVYDAYRVKVSLPKQSVRYITTPELEFIYKTRYWDLFKGDRFPAGVGYVVFDGAVNSGVGQSVKWLQRALVGYYTGPVDGLVGEGTLAAVAKHPSKTKLIADICKLRMAFLRALKTWPVFGKGWTSRVNSVCTVGQSWAAGAGAGAVDAANRVFELPEPTEAELEQQNARALPTDIKSAPATGLADASTGGGLVAATLTQAIGALTPLSGAPGIANLILYLTIAGVAVSVAGAVYSFWAKRQAAKLRAVK